MTEEKPLRPDKLVAIVEALASQQLNPSHQELAKTAGETEAALEQIRNILGTFQLRSERYQFTKAEVAQVQALTESWIAQMKMTEEFLARKNFGEQERQDFFNRIAAAAQ